LKPKLIAVNLLLAAALGVIFWQGRVELRQARAKQGEILNSGVKPVIAPTPAPAAKLEPAQPAKYAEVATKNLFSKDRNPDVVIDPPKIEAPKPMPPLPIVYGVLGLPSGARAIMSEKKGSASRPVRSGDTIGEFKIVALDTKNVVFDWDGKQISKNVDDLIDRSGSTTAAAGQGPSAPPGPAVAPPPPPVKSAAPLGPGPASTGGADRPCVQGDAAPDGTVVDGYRKFAGAPGPFGPIGCHWSPVK